VKKIEEQKQEAVDILGVSIDSTSFDQSLIDQSINSGKKRARKLKKMKEDLDRSKLLRDHPSLAN